MIKYVKLFIHCAIYAHRSYYWYEYNVEPPRKRIGCYECNYKP